MVNPFWHNPRFALEKIKDNLEDWDALEKELKWVDEKGYVQYDDDYHSKLNAEFQIALHILKCVYEDRECKLME